MHGHMNVKFVRKVFRHTSKGLLRCEIWSILHSIMQRIGKLSKKLLLFLEKKIAFTDICETIFLDVATRQAEETRRHITTDLTKNTTMKL